jgi:RHS repeat-associated protein
MSIANLLVTSGSGVDPNLPKVYLNYILFDSDFLPYDMGFDQVSSAGASAHEKLAIRALATKPGYAYIYFSNENGKVVEVYFDDFKVEHIKSPVIQSQDYYPFGLTSSSYSRENSVNNPYQFNGIEAQDEIDLNVLQALYRTMDQSIGRWWQIDPKAVEWESPYSTMSNNPIFNVDPLGDTTFVYNNRGQFMHKIDDEYENQAHFVKGAIDRGENQSDNDYALKVRENSAAFIGANTASDMNLIQEMSNSVGIEIGFVGSIGDDREIRLTALDATGNITSTISALSFNESLRKGFPEREDQASLFLFGHTHPDQAYDKLYGNVPGMRDASPENRDKILRQPSGGVGSFGDVSDFNQGLPQERIGYNRTTPTLILTSKSFSAYTASGDSGKFNPHKIKSFQ